MAMIRSALVVLVALGGSGCDNALPPVNTGIAVEATCPTGSAVGVLGEEVGSKNSWVVGEATSVLSASDLVRLWCGPMPDTIRITWIRTRRPAVVVSVQRADSDWKADALEFHDPRLLPLGAVPTIATRRSMKVVARHGDQVASDIESAQFWDADVVRQGRPEDGVGWILEVRKGPKYKAVVRENASDGRLDPVVKRLFEASNEPLPTM